MRPQKIQEEDLLLALTQVFRSRGYEGASLSELSEVTGLKKASLYHRFPGGKQEMAEAVLGHMGKWVEDHIFSAFNSYTDSADVRLKKGLMQIRKLYDGGKKTCIFRAFSMETGIHLFEQSIQNGLKQWISTFTNVGLAFGLTPDKAKENAMQSLIEIQGSLLLAKGLSNPDIFENTLQRIEKRYTEA